ncbi:MAG: NAD(P)H-hydrate dehydratase [Gammaproteobacteria bacterium]
MTELPEEIYSVQQVRELDLGAIDRLDISGYELMCRAGEAAFSVLESRWPSTPALTIFCGAGNNAGDGYVLARLVAEAGQEARVIAVTSPDQLSGAAETAWEAYRDTGRTVETFSHEMSIGDGVVVDALLGTGLVRDLSGVYLDAVTSINAADLPVLSLDIPTGLDADSGLVMGAAVHADVTVSFVGLKAGLFLGAAPDYCGQLVFAGLEIPAEVYASHPPILKLLTTATLREALPPRLPSAHKGSNGSLLLVGGGPGMPGAIRLAAEAALRAGAGLVRVATHSESAIPIVAGRPEIICRSVNKPIELEPLLEQSDAVVLGPGLGTSGWGEQLAERALDSDLAVIVDADGLNWLAEHPRQRNNWVLTPHPGEAARLAGCSTAEIQAGRLAAAKGLADQFSATVVLKGAGTIVATPNDAQPSLCDRGNAGMATAGMGDVLAGIIGAIAVQSGDLPLSARAGVLLHALAGDASVTTGERGLIASDLMPHIRRLANPA